MIVFWLAILTEHQSQQFIHNLYKMSDLKKKISELTLWTPLDTDIIPYVDLLTNTTKKAYKSDLEGADWIDWKTILNWSVDPTTEWVDGDFYINTTSWQIFWPKATTWGVWTDIIWDVWNGIASIELLSGAHSPWTLDTYRVTYTDSTTFDYQVYNGADWAGAWDMIKSTYDPDNIEEQIVWLTAQQTIENKTLNNTNYVVFDTTPTSVPTGVWTMSWNDTDGTLDLKLKGGNVTLQIWQEEVIRVVNKVWTDLLEANYQVVKITGAQWQRPKVGLAQADNDLNSATTIWLITETIANNQEWFITTSGEVIWINTTGSLQSETWADWDMLYLSPTIAGWITNIKPTAPNHTVVLGWVIYAHATQWKIFVKVDNWYELEELHNVTSTDYTGTINTDSILTFDVTNSIWKRLKFSNIKSFLKTYFDTLYAKIGTTTSSWLTMSTGKLLWRSTTWTWAIEEIALWTGLSLSGTTLNASVSGAKEIRITIPWEIIADTTYQQWLFFYNNTGATITISNIAFTVSKAAAWAGAACAFNVYKSSGTAADWLDTNAVNLFTSAVNLTTNYTSLTNVPNTTTVESGRYVSIRVTSSAWATNKASNAQIIITYT